MLPRLVHGASAALIVPWNVPRVLRPSGAKWKSIESIPFAYTHARSSPNWDIADTATCPGRMPSNLNKPSAPVVVVRPASGPSSKVTVAPPTARLLGSTTTPPVRETVDGLEDADSPRVGVGDTGGAEPPQPAQTRKITICVIARCNQATYTHATVNSDYLDHRFELSCRLVAVLSQGRRPRNTLHWRAGRR
jgi:hypothetical protein